MSEFPGSVCVFIWLCVCVCHGTGRRGAKVGRDVPDRSTSCEITAWPAFPTFSQPRLQMRLQPLQARLDGQGRLDQQEPAATPQTAAGEGVGGST